MDNKERTTSKKLTNNIKLTEMKNPLSQLPTFKTGLGVKNMKSQDITIIANGRWESTLNLHSLIVLDILGVQYEQH
jgi:hypothetical protein